jgi:uncharacterized caspase-like protein
VGCGLRTATADSRSLRRLFRTVALAAGLSGLLACPALAEKRVALVLGNANYQNVSHLPNPASDAAKLADVFKQARFDIVALRTDLKGNEMRRALREFGDKARDADVAVIYYAGHGMEVDGNNYLIPIDAMLERDTDVYDEAIPLDRLLVAVEPAKQLRLIILDACRDNPFAKTMKRTVALRAIGRGLAKVEPASPNTMIAFAAKAGFTAFDGDGKNSPYAVALAAHLTTPGLDIRKAFGFVRDEVLKATENRQEPFIYGSLGGNDVALVPGPAPGAAPPAAADKSEAIRRDYEFAERVGTREAWDFFLATYPDGFYSNLARAQRNKLAAEEQARAAANQRERLAAAGAKQAEQAKAAADASAAEQTRLAAEKQKDEEEAKVAESERATAAAQAKAAEAARIAAEKARKVDNEKAAREQAALEAKAQQAAAQAKAAEEARLAAEKLTQERIARAEADAKAAAEQAKAAEAARLAEEARAAELQKAIDAAKAAEVQRAEAQKPAGQLAMLNPPDKPDDGKPTADQVPRLLLTELRRVGCFKGSIDGSWNEDAQHSLDLFNKSAGARLDTRLASLDALDLLRSKSGRVCPLVCDYGYHPEGDACVKIVCKTGYELGEDNTCRKPTSKKLQVNRDRRPEQEKAAVTRPPGARERGNSELNRCGATSCSGALRGCINKVGIMGGNPERCQAKYQLCMQTGEFNARYCQHSGLARN